MPTPQDPRTYLGDGVSVQIELGALVLTTDNGRHVTNRIVLEPHVWSLLAQWVDRYQRGDLTDEK